MFSRIRKRFTYANVAMTLALVFAMTGGAYAAKKYLITSTKQIKPSVLAQLRGTNGTNGTNGVNGKDGAQGPVGEKGAAGTNGKDGAQGPAGPTGPKGTNGTNGATGPAGPAGATGPAGPTGQTGFTETLPSGKTETGKWGFNLHPGGADVPVSFTIPLKAPLAEPKVHFIVETNEPKGGNDTAECQGTIEEPKAAAGNFCMYDEGKNVPGNEIAELLGVTDLGTSGLMVVFVVTEAEAHNSGSWAVTAP